jgi:carbamoyl-phosphate synthase large subunit
MRAIAGPEVELHAGDIDRFAAGLHLVSARTRVILPRGDDPAFVDQLLDYCQRERIDVLIPTVDSELLPVARASARFDEAGTRVMVARSATLELVLDKLALAHTCASVCPVPRSAAFDADFDAAGWPLPIIVKPRRGAGGRGVQLAATRAELAHIPRDEAMLAQEYLPGAEYSVDVLSDANANVMAVVPRLRLKIDSGIAVAGRTLHHDVLDAAARAVAGRLGLSYVSNLQFREDSDGTPKLIEVNARFPGTMPLTVASGVDMPRLALDAVLGRPMPQDVGDFRDLAMVRTWQEHFLESDAFDQLAPDLEGVAG